MDTEPLISEFVNRNVILMFVLQIQKGLYITVTNGEDGKVRGCLS